MDKYDTNKKNYLLKSLTDIDFSKQIPIKIEKGTIHQIILRTCNSSRRVDLKCEVRCFIQRYFSQKTNQALTLINKDYQNPVNKTLSSMKIDELILRECLLLLFDQQKALFIIPKALCSTLYEKDMISLKKPKGKGKGKGKGKDKEVEEVKEEQVQYEDFLYYKIEIESIIYNHPNEPSLTKLNDYFNYINKYKEEIKYLLKNKNYTQAEKWANTIISKVFGMLNATKATLSDNEKKEMYQLMKPIVLYKTSSLTLKDGDNKMKRDGYEKAIKSIENDYYKNYPNDYDEFYLKITGRYAMYSIRLEDAEKARSKIEEIKAKFNCENSRKAIQEIESELNKGSTTEKVIRKGKKLFNAFANCNNNEIDEYEWELSTKDADEYLNSKVIDYGVINALNE